MTATVSYDAKVNYSGKASETYEKRRQRRKKWKREMAIVEDVLSRFPDDTLLVDVPVGTGRFSPLYERYGFSTIGVDISADMLRQAVIKCRGKTSIYMVQGDVLKLPLKDQSIDCVVCIRLLNWLPPGMGTPVLKELCRITKNDIIVGIRTRRAGTPGEYIKLLLRDMVPSPRHIRGWIIFLYHMIRTVIAFGKGWVARILLKRSRSGKCHRWHGKTYYNRDDMESLFGELGWAVQGEFPIDRVASYRKRQVYPYSIFWLTSKKVSIK